MRKLLVQFAIIMVAATAVMLYLGLDDLRLARAEDSRGLRPEFGAADRNAGDPLPLHLGGSRPGEQFVSSGPSGPPQESIDTGTPGDRPDVVSSPQAISDEEAEFEAAYGAMSTAQMQNEYEVTQDEFCPLVTQESNRLEANGQYKVVGYGNQVLHIPPDKTRIVVQRLHPMPDESICEIRKIELVEAECPQAFKLHRKGTWLFNRIRMKQRSAG